MSTPSQTLWTLAAMKCIIFISAFLFPCFLFGQNLNYEKVSKRDSIEIATTWKAFLQSVTIHNRKKYKSLSLNKVVCNRCRYWDIHDLFADISTKAKMPVDSFINEAFTTLEKDGLWKILENHTYSLSAVKDSNDLIYSLAFGFKPENMPEGYVHFITFRKVGKRFKFYGFDTIP